ncbi:uncharacterized protein BCR38DRAFT_411638 [Pseudomassariella vexata]|uniref:C2H2-type domain-containing protein n=1 Tax=Pseudomassariella vexata TaxID=1141098 RepID=A0A1Y2DRR3_9PEZI|nr:uncharacterized protein BCR38DRAFT_411638 [Pseudomassariella vexata]ORY61796.1 hypothetical protein BCR38DRAFT_411638 [Pseudomassariella vexata]
MKVISCFTIFMLSISPHTTSGSPWITTVGKQSICTGILSSIMTRNPPLQAEPVDVEIRDTRQRKGINRSQSPVTSSRRENAMRRDVDGLVNAPHQSSPVSQIEDSSWLKVVLFRIYNQQLKHDLQLPIKQSEITKTLLKRKISHLLKMESLEDYCFGGPHGLNQPPDSENVFDAWNMYNLAEIDTAGIPSSFHLTDMHQSSRSQDDAATTAGDSRSPATLMDLLEVELDTEISCPWGDSHGNDLIDLSLLQAQVPVQSNTQDHCIDPQYMIMCSPRDLTASQDVDAFVQNDAPMASTTEPVPPTPRISQPKTPSNRKATAESAQGKKQRQMNKVQSCPTCGKHFKGRRDYNRHIKYHDRPFACHLCESNYGDPKGLKRHIVACHKDYAHAQKEFQQYVGPFPCGVAACKKVFTRLDNRKRHWENKHSLDSPSPVVSESMSTK